MVVLTTLFLPYLFSSHFLDCSKNAVSFHHKAKRKNQDPEKFAEKVLAKEAALKRDWDKKLASQIHDLPKYDDVFREAKRHFKI